MNSGLVLSHRHRENPQRLAVVLLLLAARSLSAVVAVWSGAALAQSEPPTLLTQPQSRTNVAGTSATFSTVASGLDFGDAPDPPYPTLLANDGARHVVVPGIFLGSGVNADSDGQPNPLATGDNLPPGCEEDGVRFLSALHNGQLTVVEVVASTNGLLNAWIDFNQAGGWGRAGGQVFTNRALTAGTNRLNLLVPRTAAPGVTFGRFRFSTAANLSYTGLAPDGEVEDYALNVQPAADVLLTASSTANRVGVGTNATITVNVTNLGPSAATGVTLVSRLSGRSGFVSAVTSQGTCANANGVVTCNLGNLTAGARAAVTLVVRIGGGTNLTLTSVTANEFDPVTANNSATVSILGTITLPQYANPDAIVLPLLESGPGSVYPSDIVISGLTSSVYKVTVTLRNINHDYPDDIDVILVGPRGQTVYLMSDCGLDNALVDVSLTLDDDAAQALPDSDPQIVSGTYKPTNYGTASDGFAPPAPPPPYTTNLSVFRGSDPNGVWSLYMMDDQPENATPQSPPGFLADGWTMTLVTGDPMANLVLTQTSQPASVIVGGHIFYHIAVTNFGPADSTCWPLG